MHKKIFPDKLGGSAPGRPNPIRGGTSRHNAATGKPSRGQPDSVKNLLARAAPGLADLTRRVREQQDIAAWTRAQLPAELAGQVTEVLEKEGALTVFAASAAWAGRLRYAVADLEAALAASHPHVKSVSVRVMPKRSGRGS